MWWWIEVFRNTPLNAPKRSAERCWFQYFLAIDFSFFFLFFFLNLVLIGSSLENLELWIQVLVMVIFTFAVGVLTHLLGLGGGGVHAALLYTHFSLLISSNPLCLLCWCVCVCVLHLSTPYTGLAYHRCASCELAEVKCALIQTERYERQSGSVPRSAFLHRPLPSGTFVPRFV